MKYRGSWYQGDTAVTPWCCYFYPGVLPLLCARWRGTQERMRWASTRHFSHSLPCERKSLKAFASRQCSKFSRLAIRAHHVEHTLPEARALLTAVHVRVLLTAVNVPITMRYVPSTSDVGCLVQTVPCSTGAYHKSASIYS